MQPAAKTKTANAAVAGLVIVVGILPFLAIMTVGADHNSRSLQLFGRPDRFGYGLDVKSLCLIASPGGSFQGTGSGRTAETRSHARGTIAPELREKSPSGTEGYIPKKTGFVLEPRRA
jgi:hypothetical protein